MHWGHFRAFFQKACLAVLTVACFTASATAEVVISVNDGKVELKDGAVVARPDPTPDSAQIFDLSGPVPKLIGSVSVPVSVIGPPQSVAITPGGKYALVTSAVRADPANPGKLILDDQLSVIDLTSAQLVQQLRAGSGASGVAVNPAGTLALVCNHGEDTISVFTIADGQLSPTGKLYFDKGAGPASVAFTPDGSKALITRDGDNRISLLTINGTSVIDPGYTIYAGLRPFAIRVSRRGDVAYVSNIGIGGRDNGTVSVIDLTSDPIRVGNTVSVAPSPAGLAESPDGRYLVVSSLNGSHLEAGTSGYHDGGILQVFIRNHTSLRQVAQIRTGHGCEGVGWDGSRRILLQCYGEKALQVYSFTGSRLFHQKDVPLDAEPAGLDVEPVVSQRAVPHSTPRRRHSRRHHG